MLDRLNVAAVDEFSLSNCCMLHNLTVQNIRMWRNKQTDRHTHEQLDFEPKYKDSFFTLDHPTVALYHLNVKRKLDILNLNVVIMMILQKYFFWKSVYFCEGYESAFCSYLLWLNKRF